MHDNNDNWLILIVHTNYYACMLTIYTLTNESISHESIIAGADIGTKGVSTCCIDVARIEFTLIDI